MTGTRKTLGFIGLVCAMALLIGCGYYRHVDPLILTYPDKLVAELSARAHAKEPGCKLWYNYGTTHSMEPLIVKGDWVVSKVTGWGEHLKGKVVTYAYDGKTEAMHRLVSGNSKDGFIASGDNNSSSEARNRVTADNFTGEVVAIYRFAP